jgi:hypothetical protein
MTQKVQILFVFIACLACSNNEISRGQKISKLSPDDSIKVVLSSCMDSEFTHSKTKEVSIKVYEASFMSNDVVKEDLKYSEQNFYSENGQLDSVYTDQFYYLRIEKFVYDQNDRLVGKQFFDTEGTLLVDFSYQYDLKGRDLTEVKKDYRNGDYNFGYTIEYDYPTENELSYSYYDNEGNFRYTQKTIINKTGQPIEIYEIDEGRKETLVTTFQYDSLSLPDSEIRYSNNGYKYSESVYIYYPDKMMVFEGKVFEKGGIEETNYSFDPSCNLTSEHINKFNGQNNWEYNDYIYVLDERGNWINRTHIKDDNAVSITEREIVYY